MSKLIVCALMGMSVLFVGSVSAESSGGAKSVNDNIASTCDASPLYKQYVCQGGGLLEAVQRYDELLKPPAAYLNPVVANDQGGGSSGTGGSTGGSTDTGSTDTTSDTGSEDFTDGFQ